MLFCQNFKNVFRLRKRILTDRYSYTIADHVEQLNVLDWDYVNGERNLFLTSSFLRTLAADKTEMYQYRYVIVYENKIPIAIAYLQVVNFSAELLGEMVMQRLNDIRSRRAVLFSRYVSKNKDAVIFRLLTLGNNFISGDHGIAFVKEVATDEKFKLIHRISTMVASREKLRGRISAVLVKDFTATPPAEQNYLLQHKFLEFAVEPNMVVHIPANVTSLSAYTALFSKKYRKRARDIFKAASGVQFRELSQNEIVEYNKKIFALYCQVYSNAKFKLVQLHEDYFYEAKKNFREKFIIRGYFLNQQLIGFQSAFVMDNQQLEAHFIGLDYELNAQHELYQNMLYGFIEMAIFHNKQRVNLGRTATEIKSTVGAIPENLFCYVKPQNSVSKLVLQPFISFLQPGQWIPRNPFRE